MNILPGFDALPGCHCVTASFRKVFAYNQYPISEEMLLGLGAGAGFIYWQAGGQAPFLGGRGNHKNFNQDLSQRTGVQIEEHQTASRRVAERTLLQMLDAGRPVVIYADMPYLTYLNLPPDAHFGGHAVVVCGYDPTAREVSIADLAAHETGYKTGTLNTLSLDQLALARDSKFQPFPPHNAWFTFDFAYAHPPRTEDISAAIDQAAQAMLRPPIQNLGVPGIGVAAQRVKRWPETMTVDQLRLALFNVYVFIEIGGSGGGLFRPMYARFLEQAAALIEQPRLADAATVAAQSFHACGARWTRLAGPLAGALEEVDPEQLIGGLAEGLAELREMEADAWERLCRF